MGLYVNSFQLYPVRVRDVRKIEANNNWLLTMWNPNLNMTYRLYFGSDKTNDQLVAKLKNDVECAIYGTIKVNKAGDLILRAKQIIVDDGSKGVKE